MANRSREEMRQYMADRRARIKAEMLTRLGGQCARCGAVESLEFDHVDPATKVFHISGRGLDKPRVLLLVEVDKCQLLCRGCHAIKSADEARQTDHGVTMYRNGCRCVICRDAARRGAMATPSYRRKHRSAGTVSA